MTQLWVWFKLWFFFQPVAPTDADDDEEHGGLVKKMLESKKELEGGSQTKAKVPKKTEIVRIFEWFQWPS